MPRLSPCLMFVGDQLGRAQEAVELYTSVFTDAAVLDVERLEDGTGIRRARIAVAGHELQLMDSPGPHDFAFNPAISLMVEFEREDELDAAWERLVDGAFVLMPLQAYEFSPRFGWLADRFGVTWQLILA